MNIFLFTGAGASTELGVPTMEPMADEFWSYLSRMVFSDEEISTLQEHFTREDKDIENIIDEARKIVEGVDAFEEYGLPYEEGEFETFRKLHREAFWFVQHTCTRIEMGEARLLWEPTLRYIDEDKLTIATSNYDRSIEIAADLIEAEYQDGFEEFEESKFANWEGFQNSEKMDVIKMHGSVDWFRGDDDEVAKLRHPLSLYGEMEINFAGVGSLNNCIILPTMEKKKNEFPFTRLTTEMNTKADNSDVAIFVGTSLRDPDVRDLAIRCEDRIPTYFISPGENKSASPGTHIRQTASEFLISSLPAAVNDDIIKYLDRIANHNQDPPSILSQIQEVFSENASNRTEAIEYLSDHRIHLSVDDVKELLDADEDRVRLYSLALVEDVFNPDELREKVEKMGDNDPSEQVRDEAGLLIEELRE